MRRWIYVGRARQREADNARGGVLSPSCSSQGRIRRHATGAPESEPHVWYAAPNRWRVEGDDTTLYLSDGDQRWEGFTSFVTERGGP